MREFLVVCLPFEFEFISLPKCSFLVTVAIFFVMNLIMSQMISCGMVLNACSALGLGLLCSSYLGDFNGG